MPLLKCFPCFQFRVEEVISKLDYSNNILSESFPHVWQYERTLEELNVTSTRINYLPPQLFYCQGLTILLANNNNIETIPEAIGALRHLQQLNLSRNFISSVPDTIKACKHLSHLDLSCNTLQRLPDAITSLISLEELVLNETYLEFLPANFGRLVHLRTVELRSNSLISLPKSMQRLTNLQRLDIGANEFTKMPEVIGELKQLREFWFDFNQIRSVPVQIGKLRELQHCEANGNFIDFFPNEIGNWRNLEVLSVSTNSLSTFPFSIGMLRSLVTFKCESNELTELPDSISNLENLEELVVSHNKLLRLPNTIGMLRKLRYLFADNNFLLQLPEEICSCSCLSVLSVSRNKISELPNNIGHLTKLKVLNIVQNHIATLPVTVLSLVNLTSLWISNNQSQPMIPLQYADVSKKTHLTCFMLPQLGSKYYEQPTEDINGACQNSKHHPNLHNTHTIPARRICFAEETTILNTNQASLSSSSFTSNKNNNDINQGVSPTLAKSCSSIVSKTSQDDASLLRDGIKLVPVGSKDFLMRSPTPYPKELRLMAKYARSSHYKNLNNHDNEKTADSKDDENTIHRRMLEKQHNGYIHSETESSIHDNLGQRKYQTESPAIEQQPYDNCDNTEQLNLPTYFQNPNYFQNDFQNNDLVDVNLKILPLTTSQHDIIPNSCNNVLKPPPYHIARCFTKKTTEDLSNYEVIRKQRRHHFQNVTEINDTWDVNIELNHKPATTMNEFERDESDQNNVMDHTLRDEHNIGQIKFLKEPRGNNVDNEICIENNNTTEDSIPVEIPNLYKKSNKCRIPWLFGVHRNPTVKQVTIRLEDPRDFEIDFLPNKEGIYIVSTVPESNVSRLLCPFDKLLEVDGIDFTNINVNEARQMLNNSGPLISIMLSRK